MLLNPKFAFFNNNLVEAIVHDLKADVTVYEVIKIVSGIPLFYEDHLMRLKNSMKMAQIEGFTLTNEEFFIQIKKLCESNNQYFGNVEFRVSKIMDSLVNVYLAYIPHSYPNPTMYIEGVTCSLLKAERDKPNAKIKDTPIRTKANNILKDANLFEVLLVNNEGFITEGSRSNVFFIKDNIVFFAPVEFVLPGITRKYVIQALEKQDIKLHENLVHTNDLAHLDGAFLCGTSPGILPIKQIDAYNFDVQNKLLRSTILEFNKLVSGYLSGKS